MAQTSHNLPAEPRATWLILATDGPATELDSLAPAAARLRTVAEPGQFIALLTTDLPRVAIVTEPPAGAVEMGLLQRERRRRRQGLRTIHLSPAAAISQRIEALRAGFDDALADIVDPRELAERAAILDGHARSRRATTLPVADGFELDLAGHELRFDGATVHLRPKEFQLLATLAAHPGRAYTRRQLLDRVWGPGPGRRPQNGGRPRPLASLEDRATARPTDPPRHGSRRRLSIRSAVNGALTRRQTAVDPASRRYEP